MAIVPSSQFYTRSATFMESFQSSMLKLHVSTRLNFLRYGSTIPLKKQSFCVAFSTSMNADSSPQQNPQKGRIFDATTKNKRRDFASEPSHLKAKASGVKVSDNSWLGKWNETHKQDKVKRPRALLDYRNDGEASSSDCEDNSSGSTMERIVQKLKKFGYVDDVSDKKETMERPIEKGAIEDIFYVEEGILPNARGGFSEMKGSIEDIFYVEEGILPNAKGGFPEKSPYGVQNLFSRSGEVSFPWEKPVVKGKELNTVRQKGRTSFAELTLPEPELRRLRNMALRIKNKMRIKGSVTHEVVEKIHENWMASEVVRLKIEGTPALNMKRMHEILERKTGGLVIWRSGTSMALYRGIGYEAPSEQLKKRNYNKFGIPESSSSAPVDGNMIPLELGPSSKVDDPSSESATTSAEKGSNHSLTELDYEDEADKLLNSLGPRYTDWPGNGPLPVDADLLPGVIPGYQPPFRILPYGVRRTLGVKEATSLRRIARVLPPHFALGRSRQHQGLAVAMAKLWERSSIAKVALKRGVQLTTSERMAEDIKKLTGGILLSRNKDFLVFYRGKDFLSPEVAEALLEKEKLAKTLQDEEEQARLRASALVTSSVVMADESGIAGTLGETLDADARWGKKLEGNHEETVMREVEMLRHASLVRKLQRKLDIAEKKIMKAERALSKVEQTLNPVERSADPNSITDEERFMFRKLGLRMKAYLLLGRRGVFDGTVENMHLHWKYRELVKIMVNAKSFEEVKAIALSLESESGGVLVSVDKVSKGYAIIVFRGKDYKRPSFLRPKNLLTKRKALARSIELQRRQALLMHLSQLQTTVDKIRSEIGQMEDVKDQGDEELYGRLESSYPSEDEDSEEEEEDIDLESCSSGIEISDESGHSTNNHYSEDVSETEYVQS